MLLKGVTLRGLEVFETLASTGSVAKTSVITGLSQPAVSQQLRNLEKALGVDLIDHSRRPMRLTHTGHSFLDKVGDALDILRRTQSELSALELDQVETLNVGISEDLSPLLAPPLLADLATRMAATSIAVSCGPGADLLARLHGKALHMVVACAGKAALDGITEYPMLHDPYLLVAPRGTPCDLTALGPETPLILPLVGQHRRQQVEQWLDAAKILAPRRFDMQSAQMAMAMVAQGGGITITTALTFVAASALHGQLLPQPLPFAAPARRVSLFTSAEWAGPVPEDIARAGQAIALEKLIQPARLVLPWLAEHLNLIDG